MTSLESLDYTGPILAKVVDNNDPLKRQRVKLKPLSKEILSTEDLDLIPWCTLLHGVLAPGQNSTSCVIAVPEVGTILAVEFQHGNLLYGVVQGIVPTDDFPVPALLSTNYPHRRGTQDKAGTVMYIDSQSPEVFLKIGGTTVSIKNGSVTVNVGGGTIDLTASSVNVHGNFSVSQNVTVTGDSSVGGNNSVSGAVTAASIAAPSGTIGGINLTTHKHLYSDNGNAHTTGPMQA